MDIKQFLFPFAKFLKFIKKTKLKCEIALLLWFRIIEMCVYLKSTIANGGTNRETIIPTMCMSHDAFLGDTAC